MICGLLLLDCVDDDDDDDVRAVLEGWGFGVDVAVVEEVVVLDDGFEGVEGVEVVGRLGAIEAVVVVWRELL